MAAVWQANLVDVARRSKRPLSAAAPRMMSACNGLISATVGAKMPTLLPDRTASSANSVNAMLLPHRRPQTNATRLLARMRSMAIRCDGCGAIPGRKTAPRGRSSKIEGISARNTLAVRKASDEQRTGSGDLSRLILRPRLEGRPWLVRGPPDDVHQYALAVEGAGKSWLSAAQEVGRDRGDDVASGALPLAALIVAGSPSPGSRLALCASCPVRTRPPARPPWPRDTPSNRR